MWICSARVLRRSTYCTVPHTCQLTGWVGWGGLGVDPPLLLCKPPCSSHLILAFPPWADIPPCSLAPYKIYIKKTKNANSRLYTCCEQAMPLAIPSPSHTLGLRYPYYFSTTHTRTFSVLEVKEINHALHIFSEHNYRIWL